MFTLYDSNGNWQVILNIRLTVYFEIKIPWKLEQWKVKNVDTFDIHDTRSGFNAKLLPRASVHELSTRQVRAEGNKRLPSISIGHI